ncbi:MAG: hypothetical protein JO291_11730 [Acidimicrobiia bacterium]|nr:hypothetical protein [Acidimicrobiia bacterium]
MELTVVRVPEWPSLAWVAECRGNLITANIGSRVEVGDGWLAEAAWAGPFADGDFDRTDIVSGTGVRVRDERAVFVSSGSTIDRLQSMRTEHATYVSNTLPGLLAFAGSSLLLSCTSYSDIFASIVHGIARYERDLPTSGGPVRLHYFANVEWDGATLRDVEKPFGSRDFSSFEKYRAFLAEAIGGLAENGRAAERRHPIGLMSSLSSGYDSAVGAVLAHEAGGRDAFGFDADSGGRDDDATPLAEALGLDFHLLESADAPRADLLFLAAGVGHGGEAILRRAESFLAGRLVLFGHWGDAIWGFAETDTGPDLVRWGTSGTSVLEYRLVAGFLQCPVPVLGGRQIADVRRIGRDPEMEPWSVGGDYDRPVARRIIEEAGVPRNAFATRKRGVLMRQPKPNDFLTPELREDYLRWLRVQRWSFARQRTIPASSTWDKLTLLRGVDPGLRRRLHRYVSHWAIDRTKDRYPRP